MCVRNSTCMSAAEAEITKVLASMAASSNDTEQGFKWVKVIFNWFLLWWYFETLLSSLSLFILQFYIDRNCHFFAARDGFGKFCCYKITRTVVQCSFKNDFAFRQKHANFDPTCTSSPISMKSCTVDCVGEMSEKSKLGWEPTSHAWNKRFCNLKIFFFAKSTGWAALPIVKPNGSNNVV